MAHKEETAMTEKFGEKLGKAASKTGYALGETYRFVKLLALLVFAGFVFGSVYFVYHGVGNVWSTVKSPLTPIFGTGEPPKPPEERDPQLQLQCATAIIAKDIEGEAGQHLGVVRREVAYTVTRFRTKYPGATTCDILAKAQTIVPVGWKYPVWWVDRKVWFMRHGQTAAAWTTAELVAKETYGKTPPSGCATHYVRAEINLRTGGPSWEKNAAAALLEASKSDPSLENAGFRLKFLCPR